VVVVAGGGLHVHLVAVARDREDRHGLQELDPVPSRLLDDPLGKLGPPDALREAGIVVEAFGHAGLSAQTLAVDDEGLEVLAGCVDRRREACRASTDDDQVVDVHHGHPLEPDLLGQLLVGGLGQEGLVREDDRGDDVVPVVPGLDDVDAVGILLDVVPFERDTLVAQEALGPSAVRAPACPVHPDLSHVEVPLLGSASRHRVFVGHTEG